MSKIGDTAEQLPARIVQVVESGTHCLRVVLCADGSCWHAKHDGRGWRCVHPPYIGENNDRRTADAFLDQRDAVRVERDQLRLLLDTRADEIVAQRKRAEAAESELSKLRAQLADLTRPMTPALRPMAEAPTAAGEGEFLVRVEFADGTRCWLCIAPTGNGDWDVCGGLSRVGPDAEGWVIEHDRMPELDQRVKVLGWIPAPGVPAYTEVAL